MDSKEPQPLSACHPGVVLRVVLTALLVVGLGTGFAAHDLYGWLLRWLYACVGVIPAVCLWLVVVCALSKRLARWPLQVSRAGVALMGGLAGGYGYFQMSLIGWWLGETHFTSWSWIPPVVAGALAASVCAIWLEQRQRQRAPAQTQARLEELRARIRPHFLFNTLNTAMALVQADPERAEEVLQDLAELFRRALSEPDAQSPLAEEIDLARRYLSIEQLRFGDRLQVCWQLDPLADASATPVLLLQPLVENAIRHGVEPCVDGGWVEVVTERQKNHVVLTVRNSLPPEGSEQVPAIAGHGLALLNVQQRLQLLHDVEARFEAGPQPPSALHVQPHFMVKCVWPA